MTPICRKNSRFCASCEFEAQDTDFVPKIQILRKLVSPTGSSRGCGPFYKAPSRAPPEPPARARILSHTTSVAERHPCAASLANSPPPSSRVEAVGQHRGRRAAHPHCQPPGDVVAALRLAPSPLPLRVRRPAPFEHFAVGAMPRLSISERSRAEPTALSTSFITASSIS